MKFIICCGIKSEYSVYYQCNHCSKDTHGPFFTSISSVVSSNKTFPCTDGAHTVLRQVRDTISHRSGRSRKRMCPPDVTGDGKVESRPAEPHILLREKGLNDEPVLISLCYLLSCSLLSLPRGKSADSVSAAVFAGLFLQSRWLPEAPSHQTHQDHLSLLRHRFN